MFWWTSTWLGSFRKQRPSIRLFLGLFSHSETVMNAEFCNQSHILRILSISTSQVLYHSIFVFQKLCTFFWNKSNSNIRILIFGPRSPGSEPRVLLGSAIIRNRSRRAAAGRDAQLLAKKTDYWASTVFFLVDGVFFCEDRRCFFRVWITSRV